MVKEKKYVHGVKILYYMGGSHLHGMMLVSNEFYVYDSQIYVYFIKIVLAENFVFFGRKPVSHYCFPPPPNVTICHFCLPPPPPSYR